MADSNDHAVRLRALLSDLAANKVSTADAAAQVRTMHFPAHPGRTVGQRMTDSSLTELPEHDPEGSFREAARAYSRGKINLRQYETLSAAAAESIKADEQT